VRAACDFSVLLQMIGPHKHMLRMISLGAAEDAPYGKTAPFKDAGGGFKSSWANDMPSFFQGEPPVHVVCLSQSTLGPSGLRSLEERDPRRSGTVRCMGCMQRCARVDFACSLS